MTMLILLEIECRECNPKLTSMGIFISHIGDNEDRLFVVSMDVNVFSQ